MYLAALDLQCAGQGTGSHSTSFEHTFQPAATEDRQNPDPRCAQRKGRGFRNDDDVHAKRALPLLRARARSDTIVRGGEPSELVRCSVQGNTAHLGQPSEYLFAKGRYF
jgi:hypothetical protein